MSEEQDSWHSFSLSLTEEENNSSDKPGNVFDGGLGNVVKVALASKGCQ